MLAQLYEWIATNLATVARYFFLTLIFAAITTFLIGPFLSPRLMRYVTKDQDPGDDHPFL